MLPSSNTNTRLALHRFRDWARDIQGTTESPLEQNHVVPPSDEIVLRIAESSLVVWLEMLVENSVYGAFVTACTRTNSLPCANHPQYASGQTYYINQPKHSTANPL